MNPRLAILALALVLPLTGCQSGPASTASTDTDAALTGTTLDRASTASIDAPGAVLVVHGLGCPLCAHNVDGQLEAIAGVKDAEIDLGTGNVTVNFEGEPRPSPAQLAAAVDRAGFTLVRIFTK